MSMSAKLRRAPTRLVTGAFILSSGVGKLGGDDDTAKGVHGMASNAYPIFEKIEPKLFLRILAGGEVALGAALLLPVVPVAAAGLGLSAFSGALLGMYWRTPSMHRSGDPRPTREGIAVSKDIWMFGIGAGLVVDAATARLHDKRLEVTHHVKEAAAVNTVKAGALADAAKGASRRAYKKARKAAAH
jgi:hypothetical protein